MRSQTNKHLLSIKSSYRNDLLPHLLINKLFRSTCVAYQSPPIYITAFDTVEQPIYSILFYDDQEIVRRSPRAAEEGTFVKADQAQS